MNIDYNKLSVPAMRELLRLHPARQVIRHFEARGYSRDAIKANYEKMLRMDGTPIKPNIHNESAESLNI